MFSLLRKKRDDKQADIIQNGLKQLPSVLQQFLDACPIEYKLSSYIQPLSDSDDTVYNGMVRQKTECFEIEILETIRNEYLAREVVLHEIGHIIDIFLGDKFYNFTEENDKRQVQFISDSVEMNINYKSIYRILTILLDEEDYSYYMENEREMFAELFALYYSGHYQNAFASYPGINRLFVQIEDLAREKLKELTS